MKGKGMRLAALASAWLMCIGLAAGCQNESDKKESEINGYRALTPYHMGFIAVGTEGRIGSVDVDTKQAETLSSPVSVTLRDITSYNGDLMIVGDGGTVVTSSDAQSYIKGDTGTKEDLYAVVRWNDRYVAGGDKGTLIYSEDGKLWNELSSGVDSRITGLAASQEMCVGVTDKGQVITSQNLTDWTVMDYNSYYDQETAFERVVWTDTVFYAVGQDAKEGPIVTSSLSGDVWTSRLLTYYNGEAQSTAGLTMTGLAWDGQQLFASCNEGRLYTMPDCTQCNKMEPIGSGNYTAIAYNGGKLAAVGEDYTVAVVDTEAVRQYNISSDTALTHQKDGAVIIDVRGAEEYAPKHIKGAVNIPLDQIDAVLATQVPDKKTELIFYCSKGVRSQTALEKAREMGYQTVYSLGAMSNWTHDFDGTEAGSGTTTGSGPTTQASKT